MSMHPIAASPTVLAADPCGASLAGPVDVLEQLLAPLDPRVFVEEYWGRQPVHIKGTLEKFRDVFSRERFHKAVESAGQKTYLRSFRLSAVVRDFDGAWTRTEPITPEDIPATLAEGSTICVNDITIGDEQLAALCEAVKRRMNFAGGVRFNCYLSPDGSGADTHLDTSVSTTLQIEGRKRWRYAARPALAWPPSNAQLQRDGTRLWSLPWVGHRPWEQLDAVRTEDFTEVVLEPGDVLCLPAGTWHNAKAIGHSLALNMAFAPISGFSVLTRILELLFEGHELWRGGPPAAYTDGPDVDEIPVCVRQYFEARLQEVCDHLETVDVNGEVVRQAWRDLVTSGR